MALIAPYHTISCIENAPWGIYYFKAVLGVYGMWYNPLWAVRLSQKYITSYVYPWERVCSNSEAMGGYCSPPPPHLPVWESTPKSGIYMFFWQEKLMLMAQDDTKEAGRCLYRHLHSYICICYWFWNTSIAMDGSHCTISHHFLHWECTLRNLLF